MRFSFIKAIIPLLLLTRASAVAANIDVSSPDNPDPWLTTYNRFSKDLPECSSAAGYLLIKPNYARILLYYDTSQKDPMLLSFGGAENNSVFFVENKTCRLSITIMRTIGWDDSKTIAAAEINKNLNTPRTENPAMVGEIHYEEPNMSCTQIELPFFLDRNNISFSQSDSFLMGYRFSAHQQDSGLRFDNMLERPGCKVKVQVMIQIREGSDWSNSTFKH